MINLWRVRDLFVCRAIGHTVDLMDCNGGRCFRCGEAVPPGAKSDLGFWLTWWYWRGKVRIPDWRRCPSCGRRCGNTCLPF